MKFLKKILVILLMCRVGYSESLANRDYSSGCVYLAKKALGLQNNYDPLSLLDAFRGSLPGAPLSEVEETANGRFPLGGTLILDSRSTEFSKSGTRGTIGDQLAFLKTILEQVRKKQNQKIILGARKKEGEFFVFKNPSLDFFNDPELFRVFEKGIFLDEAMRAQGREKLSIQLNTLFKTLNRRAIDGFITATLVLGVFDFSNSGGIGAFGMAGVMGLFRYFMAGGGEWFQFFSSRQKNGLRDFLNSVSVSSNFMTLKPGEWFFQSRRVYLHPDLIEALEGSNPEALSDGLIRQLYAQNTSPVDLLNQKIGQLRPKTLDQNEFRGHLYKLEPVYIDVLFWNPPTGTFDDVQMQKPHLLVSIRQ